MNKQITVRAAAVATARSAFLDGRRLLRALVLGAWSGFFGWLWISGEMSRFLGPRTYWVVPFGFVALGAASAAHFMTLRVPARRPHPSAVDLVSAVLLGAPLLAVAAVPDADLGSLAASRKSTSSGVSAAEALAPEGLEPVKNPSFREIAYAQESNRYAQTIGVTEGTETKLLGFVEDGKVGTSGTFELTRFYVSCCAADAIPFSVAVDPGTRMGTDLEEDDWVEVEGVLERRDDLYVLVARRLEVVPEPSEPYLY